MDKKLKKRWKLLKKNWGKVVEEFLGKREGVFPFREGEIFFCEGVYVKRGPVEIFRKQMMEIKAHRLDKRACHYSIL